MSDNILDQLTPAQQDVALLVAEGYSLPEVARKLQREQTTVKNHLGCIYYRLGISNRDGHSPRIRLARMVWESQVSDLVEQMLAERRVA